VEAHEGLHGSAQVSTVRSKSTRDSGAHSAGEQKHVVVRCVHGHSVDVNVTVSN
jgi:hypothetical protein